MRVKTRNVDNIKLDGEVIDEVEDFAYLGSNITKDGGSDRDIVARIGKARTDFATEACREIKLRIFNTNVKSVLLYGSETWRATKETSRKLQSFVNRCLRSILGNRWPEVIRNEELWERAEHERIDTQISRRKWGWSRHTLRKPASNIIRHALKWNPQGKRSRDRPRNSWRKTVDDEVGKASYTWRELETHW